MQSKGQRETGGQHPEIGKQAELEITNEQSEDPLLEESRIKEELALSVFKEARNRPESETEGPFPPRTNSGRDQEPSGGTAVETLGRPTSLR
jgi:hypothetical protein